MDFSRFWLIVILLVITIFILRSALRSIIIYEYEKGLKYRKGKFVEMLGAGKHWYIKSSGMIVKIDIRPQIITVPGQEIISVDGITLKVSLSVNYEVADPVTATNKIQNYKEALYSELQTALREIIGNTDIDNVLEKRNELTQKVFDLTTPKARLIGIKINSVNIKDIMFPGDLKQVFAQVVKARKEGLATLEKTRGETAALRNLLNAAKILEENPLLVQLRAMQSTGNTLVFGLPDASTMINKDKHGKA